MGKISRLTLANLTSKNRNIMEKAFNAIYDEYSYLVFYISFDITKDKELSKDIVNDVFMKFYDKRFTIKDNKGLKFYLAKSAKNISLNYLKKESPTVEYNDELAGQEDKKDDFFNLLGSFSEFLDNEELDLLIYRFLYDFKFADIANIKGVTIDSASSKYRRAIEKIRKYYRGK